MLFASLRTKLNGRMAERADQSGEGPKTGHEVSDTECR